MADYNAVHKDKCLTEFMRLKDCYLVSAMPYPLFSSFGGVLVSNADSRAGCGEEAVMIPDGVLSSRGRLGLYSVNCGVRSFLSAVDLRVKLKEIFGVIIPTRHI